MAVDVGSAVGYLDLDISGFLANLQQANDEADKQSKNIATKIGGIFTGAGKTLTSVGTTLTKTVSVPLLGIGAAGLKVAIDFEKGMSEVQAISGAVGEDFEDLKDTAIELGASTAFSANEVAAGMTEMAKAGWDSQQIIEGMSGVLDAAAASGEGLATVSTIVADTITGFGMEAKESTKVADLLTQAANSGTIGITDLGESFKYIAPVAGSMGLSVEDVTTAIAAMSKAGIKGSQAGTSLRGMLTRMVKPTDDVAVAMEELGISLTEQDGSFKSLDTIIAEMRGSFDGLTDKQKTYYAAVLAGQEGMSGMLSLLNLSQEEYDEIAASMDNAGGVAAATATVMQDNLGSKIEQFIGSLESLAIKLADYLIPYLQTFVEWLTGLVEKFTALDPKTQKMILKFAGLAIAIGPVVAVLGKIVSGVGGVMTAFGKISSGFTAVAAGGKAGAGALSKFGGMLAGISAPIIAVAALIAVLAGAFVSLWKNNEEFRNKVTEIWNQVKETFSTFTQGIVERLNSLGFDFTSITDVIKTIWQGFCDFLAPYFIGVFQFISNTFTTITSVILGVVDFFIAIFKGDWEGAWNSVKGIFESIWNGIVAYFENIGTMLTGILDTVCGWFGTTWDETWNSIQTFFMNTWNNITTWFNSTLENIKSFFASAWDNISTKVSTALNNIQATMSSIWESIKTTVSNVWNGIKTTISTVWTNIKTAITTAINNVKTKVSTTFNSIKTTATNVWNNIKTAIITPFDDAKTKVSTAVNFVKNTISNGFNSAKTTVSTVFNSIKTKISDTLESAKTTVSNAIDKIKGFFDFEWSLPKISLPHFKINGGEAPWGWGGKGSFPSISVSWYAKAMKKGMILNSPTIFGFNKETGEFLGAGEAGSETVVGTNSLLGMIRQTVKEAVGPIISAAYRIARASSDLGYVTYNGFTKQSQILERAVASVGSNSGGDTFIFNSPNAIDEIEAAKQMKKAKRELAEGF